jgi:cytoskeletal protein RodZ
MAYSKSAGPDGFNDRRAIAGPARQALTPYRRESGASGAARQRPASPESASSEDPKWDSGRSVRASKLARGVLMGGMLLAVVGVVQAAWMPEEKNVSPSVAQETLAKQIDQLKAQLDHERAEKSELLEKLATAEAPAESSAESAPPESAAIDTPPESANVEPAAAENLDFPAAVPPSAVPAPVSLQQASAEVPAPASDRSAEKPEPGNPQPVAPSAEAGNLPQAMAPSAELLLTSVAVEPGKTTGEGGAYGIHLASFADRAMAERGWALLQRNHPGALSKLKPRVDEAKEESGKPVFLLIAGPFDSEALAAAHCRKITTQVVFCKPRPFSGSEFASAVAQ